MALPAAMRIAAVMNATLRRFGENLKMIRVGQGQSQESLAHASGIAVSYLSQIENGSRNPSLLVIVALAKALNVSTRDLLGDLDP